MKNTSRLPLRKSLMSYIQATEKHFGNQMLPINKFRKEGFKF